MIIPFVDKICVDIREELYFEACKKVFFNKKKYIKQPFLTKKPC